MNNINVYREGNRRALEYFNENDYGQSFAPRAERESMLWKQHAFDLANAPEKPFPIILHNNKLVGSRCNITPITGKPKSKKTFLCVAIAGGFLSEDGFLGFSGNKESNGKVLWIDTEQAPFHVSEVVRRVHRIAKLPKDMSSDRFIMLTVRGIDPKRRYDVLKKAIADIQPDLIVIDGISDLLSNTNDIEKSEELVANLLELTTKYNNHIVVVLHTNPNSDKARGHLGSVLERKAESMLLLEVSEQITTVKPKFSRNVDFEKFAFSIDDSGLPCLTNIPPKQIAPKSMPFEEFMEIDKTYLPKELVVLIVEKDYGTSEGTARQRISRALKNGDIIKNDFGEYYLPNYDDEVEEN